MFWEKIENTRLPIKSWCEAIEDSAMKQAINLANHTEVFKHVAIMPDCHTGYGMPIGGVIACENSIIPNAVGVDIGCGMGAVKTDIKASVLSDKSKTRKIIDNIKRLIPIGEGHCHKAEQPWSGFTSYLNILKAETTETPGWITERVWTLAKKNLGTLGGGNHFIELQSDKDGFLWLMLHSGSRNLGFKVAEYHHKKAQRVNRDSGVILPDKDLAYLCADSNDGKSYIRDMNFALEYARENRSRMMDVFKDVISDFFPDVIYEKEINIHHNYASLENHFGKKVWVHRKGATSAQKGELGIIPGSMGTPSYIVQGLGNPESFMSCSHGAGRVMSRTKACKELTLEECNKAMGNVVFDRWKKRRSNMLDFGESPLAYKNIDDVINAQLDLIKPLVKLKPIGVIKG